MAAAKNRFLYSYNTINISIVRVVLWWSCNEILCILCVISAIYGIVNIKIYSNNECGGDGPVMTKNV